MPVPTAVRAITWRDVAWPKEHGSWSLALEPVVLGLLVAPAWGGVALAVAVIGTFFLRRPLRIAASDPSVDRKSVARRTIVALAAVVTLALIPALLAGAPGWWLWLIPTAAAGGYFLWCDLRRQGRESSAELVGSVAFAWLPAVFAAQAGWPARLAVGAGLVMLARAVPTVLTVRATVRGRKTGHLAGAIPVTCAWVAVAVVLVCVAERIAPRVALVLVALFAVRSFVLLVAPRPALRASTIGMIEAALGAAYVLVVGLAWRS